MTRNAFLFILILVASQSLHAQKIDKYFEDQQSTPFQKLYLHTDREFYFAGDTLWFAAYLVDGQSHSPVPEDCNLYLDLVNSKGTSVVNDMFLLENGFCSGWIPLSDSVFKEGNYFLRSYNDYLKNLNEDILFTKKLKISEIRNSSDQLTELDKKVRPNDIDVSFYPEGGFLLADKINPVAFKVVDKNGNNVDIKGKLVNDTGRTLCDFRTRYNGMGIFYFIPQKNIEYKIEIEGYPEINPIVPEIKDEGSKLLIGKQNDRNLVFTVLTSNPNPVNPFYLALMHRGEGTYFLKIESSEVSKRLHLRTKVLKPGVNRLILLNHNFEPLSERLVFYEGNKDIQLNLNLNKNEFSTREKVSIQFDDRKNLLKDEAAQVSVVVLEENIMNASGISQNIKSYLLLDSELCGPISAPSGYFVDDEEISSATKLNMLMMVNGWKNYIWNQLRDKKTEADFEPLAGLTFDGIIQSSNQKKNLSNAEVTLGLFTKDKEQVFTTSSDMNGNFRFRNIQFYDSATVFVQGKNARERTNTSISLQNIGFPVVPVNQNTLQLLNQLHYLPVSVHRTKYLNNLALKEFYPDINTRIIKDINVVAEKIEKPDQHFRMYGVPSISLKVDEKDYAYPSVFEYLSGRVAGVRIAYRPPQSMDGIPQPVVVIRGKQSLLLVDGMPESPEYVRTLSMFDVDKIEIIKGAKKVILGVEGYGGAVSILTKRGESRTIDSGPVKIPGTIVKKIKGFSKHREFYSPKYTSENITSKAPDFRTTLYWNPKVNLENGNAELSFFTCDNITRYKVFVEGITGNGKICLGEAEFEVNERTEQ